MTAVISVPNPLLFPILLQSASVLLAPLTFPSTLHFPFDVPPAFERDVSRGQLAMDRRRNCHCDCQSRLRCFEGTSVIWR